MFERGQEYTRRQLFRLLGVPEDIQGGNWFTGYNEYKGSFYVFANVGTPGRTGHDYANKWVGPELEWYAKSGTNIQQPQVLRMISSDSVHVFWRERNQAPFRYAGTAVARLIRGGTPVEIVWAFP